jgi:hypothetical protein
MTYDSFNFYIANTEYRVTVATGKSNYVSVRKVTAMTSRIGTDFKTFSDAISHYKNPSIKVELLKIEMGLAVESKPSLIAN